MIMCDKDDLELAGLIVEQHNASVHGDINRESELEEQVYLKSDELYHGENGEEPVLIEVPVELFHRMAAEVEHHKAMLTGRGAGVVVTLGGSTTSAMEYGVAKDLEFTFRLKVRAPEGEELTDARIDEMVDCAIPAWRATLVRETDQLKAEMVELRDKLNRGDTES